MGKRSQQNTYSDHPRRTYSEIQWHKFAWNQYGSKDQVLYRETKTKTKITMISEYIKQERDIIINYNSFVYFIQKEIFAAEYI